MLARFSGGPLNGRVRDVEDFPGEVREQGALAGFGRVEHVYAILPARSFAQEEREYVYVRDEIIRGEGT